MTSVEQLTFGRLTGFDYCCIKISCRAVEARISVSCPVRVHMGSKKRMSEEEI